MYEYPCFVFSTDNQTVGLNYLIHFGDGSCFQFLPKRHSLPFPLPFVKNAKLARKNANFASAIKIRSSERNMDGLKFPRSTPEFANGRNAADDLCFRSGLLVAQRFSRRFNAAV